MIAYEVFGFTILGENGHWEIASDGFGGCHKPGCTVMRVGTQNRKPGFDEVDILEANPFILETDGQYSATGQTRPEIVPMNRVLVENHGGWLKHLEV